MRNYFCGWYFRCQSDQQTLALIPSVHRTKGCQSCARQLITDTQSFHVPFSCTEFQNTTIRSSWPEIVLEKWESPWISIPLPFMPLALYCLVHSRLFSMTSWVRSGMFPLCSAGTAFTVCGIRWTGPFPSTVFPMCFKMPWDILKGTVGTRFPGNTHGHSAAFQMVT